MTDLFEATDADDLFFVEVKVAATVYVKASSSEEAEAKFRKWMDTDRNLFADCQKGEGDFCGLAFDDERMPEVSLSPVMTLHGPWAITE